jgi:hypothetical protein
VCGLECEEDAFGARGLRHRGERLVVGRREVGDALALLEGRVLGADAWVIEAGADRMRLGK